MQKLVSCMRDSTVLNSKITVVNFIEVSYSEKRAKNSKSRPMLMKSTEYELEDKYLQKVLSQQ